MSCTIIKKKLAKNIFIQDMPQYQLKTDYIYQKIKDKIIIFDGEKSILFTLNATASYIFLQIKKNVNKKDIIELLMKKYKIPSEKVSKDVENLIKEMISKSILYSEEKQ